MLYVFQVDTGTVMTFEVNLALENVGQLKDVIEKTHRIPVDKQVLLVSGGECLDPCAKIWSYSAGTDTNPIFLFSKCTLENAKPPSPSIDYGSDSEIIKQVENSLKMPASLNTIAKRAEIALQFCYLAREHLTICESLVHDQHLQQQGWAAAVANLEDITADFKTKSEIFEQNYMQYLEDREENLKLLQNFVNDLQILTKIPILEPLLENALNFSTGEEKKLDNVDQKSNSNNDKKDNGTRENSEKIEGMTLFTWISAADNQSNLEQLAEQAQQRFEKFDEKVLEALKKDIKTTLEAANKCELKEIKGLEERLFGLEQLMIEMKKIVQEQTDRAQALQQNQSRAKSLNDTSVFQDLCDSHREQLSVMLENQHKLRDIRRRCSKAKEELSTNLYHRLGWVMYVENLVQEVSNTLFIYHGNLKKLRKYLDIARQIQRTPEVYVAAVTEVVRRRTFSQAFLTWASDLSCRLLAIYNEEYEKRKDFQSQFDDHFLKSLFPGFEDNPSTFATQAPVPFDVRLPHLTTKDLEILQAHLPELPMNISSTKLSTISQLFLTNLITETKLSNIKENDPVEDQLVVAISEAGLANKLDKTLLQPADQDLEGKNSSYDKNEKYLISEKYSEETEKELPTEEVSNLKFHLTEAGKLANQTAIYLKTELVEMKSQSLTDKENILALVKDIQSHVLQLNQRYTEEVEELQQNLNEVMQSKISEVETIKQVVKEKEQLLDVVTDETEKLKNLLQDTENVKKELNDSLTTNQQICEELKQKLKNAVQEKANAIQLVTDEFQSKILSYEERLNKFEEENNKALEEQRQKLCGEYDLKIEEVKSALLRCELDFETEKEKTIIELKEKHKNDLKEELEKLKQKMVEEAEIEKTKAVKEITDKLTLEFKTEIENLRSKFRLMSAANMEKCSSDGSLEKIEKVDVIEVVNHEGIIAELKLQAEADKEKAITAALEAEREKLKIKLEEELKLGRTRMEEEKQIWLKEAVNRAMVEKNNQIEMLLIRQETLTAECQRYRDSIKLLTEGEHFRSASISSTGENVDHLLEKIEHLEKKNTQLVSELDKRKTGVIGDNKIMGDMTASVAVVPISDVQSKDAATSPEFSGRGELSREKMPKSTSGIQQGKISITSCGLGDLVLVVWNIEHANYTILQETSTLYFLHSDCLDSLGLRPSSDGSPRSLYCIAQVVEKEYCHAKKSENRYKVPKGTKFYRVKVRPVINLKESLAKGCNQQTQGSHLDSRMSAKSLSK